MKWRLRLLFENDIIVKLLGAPRTRFSIADAMDKGYVFVIDNAIEHLDDDGSSFLGRFFLAQIWGAAMARASRPYHQKKPVYVYIDEADLVIKNDPTIAAIIDRCRSQKVALICAMQRFKQIEDPNVLSALENCAIKMANVGREASYFSNLLHIPEERINQLPQGHFAIHIREEGSSIVQVPLAQLPYRTMTEEEQRAHQQRMIDLYGYTPKTPEPPKKEGSDGAPATKKARPPKATGAPAAADPHTGAHTEPSSKWGS